MNRLLLIAALLVASVAPAWAQSDRRWIAIFDSQGGAGKGLEASAGPRANAGTSRNRFMVLTMLDRMAIPYKIIPLPDSAGGWSKFIGDIRDTDEPDSTHFRKNGCMGWISFMYEVSAGFGSYEIAEFFTDANNNTGVQQGSPIDGNWGIPGVMFVRNGASNTGLGVLTGMHGVVGKTSTAKVRQAFADNGDSISIQTDLACIISPAQAANVTEIMHSDTLDGSGSAVIAWRYRTNTLYYHVSAVPYHLSGPSLLLGVADLLRRAGYTPRYKLNLHITNDHPYPDAVTTISAPSESLAAYIDARPWRYSGAIEAHANETANDHVALSAFWKLRKDKYPAHVHSHDYLNFDSQFWNMTTYADSATKRARWNYMTASIKDTIQATPQRGYENVGTFPDNRIHYEDLWIMAESGIRDIRLVARDSIGGGSGQVNLRMKSMVTSPRSYVAGTITNYGRPYAWVEPKTNKLMYMHDSSEHPNSADSTFVTTTDFTQDTEGFANRNLADVGRHIIFDGAVYWHGDRNLTGGGPGQAQQFMALFYRRLTYFWSRVSNIVDVQPIYMPRNPRKGGGTSRSTYTDHR